MCDDIEIILQRFGKGNSGAGSVDRDRLCGANFAGTRRAQTANKNARRRLGIISIDPVVAPAGGAEGQVGALTLRAASRRRITVKRVDLGIEPLKRLLELKLAA